MTVEVFSKFPYNPPAVHFYRVATTYNVWYSRDALLRYLIWLEGDGSYEIGIKRGTHVNYPIIETKHHFYLKRNGVLTWVRKSKGEQKRRSVTALRKEFS